MLGVRDTYVKADVHVCMCVRAQTEGQTWMVKAHLHFRWGQAEFRARAVLGLTNRVDAKSESR